MGTDIATGWDIVQQRLGLGGYRLALLLKEIEYCFSDDSNCPGIHFLLSIIYYYLFYYLLYYLLLSIIIIYFIINICVLDQSEPSSDKPSKTWFIVGIALAVALGISILINIILYPLLFFTCFIFNQ